MAKARSWVLGGCLFVIVGMVGMFFLGKLVMTEAVPSEGILSLRLDRKIVEITSEDPLAQLFGEQPLSMRDIRRALRTAAQDDGIKGVRVRVDSFGGGIANAQEIRELLRGVSRAGKWTAAYMDTAGEFGPGNTVYYIASACDEISLNPAGDVNLIGFSVRSPFIRGTLDKLEIKPEFPGRGAYKTARFMYTKKDFTPEAREMMGWLVGSLEDQLVNGVASGRKLDPETVRELMDRGPLSADEALKAGLVDHLEDWYSCSERLKEKASGDPDFVSLAAYLKTHRSPATGPRIAVITAVGAIARGESGNEANPMFGGNRMGSDTIARAWRKVRKTSRIKAVVFRIDSPGGSAVASEIIRQEMARTAEKIPVVVSMSNLAASGGYWITCGAQKIVADPATLTASIGVFGGHLNMDGFWRDKLGVTFGRLDTNRNSAIYGGLEDWTDEQRAIINKVLDRIYNQFTGLVAKSRKMTPEQVDSMGRGRVFTGEQALEKGLVDELGGFDEAVALAKKLAGISPETAVRLVDYPRPEPWWRRILQRGSAEDSTRQALTELRRAWETGELAIPGVVWLPPLYIR